MDKRRTLRVSTRFEAKLETVGALKKAYIKNVSGGGLYIETDQFLAVGTKLSVSLTLPGGTEAEVLECEVAWSNPKRMDELPPGIGVKFLNLSDRTYSKIQKLIESTVETELKKKLAPK